MMVHPVDWPPWLFIMNCFLDCIGEVKDHLMCKEMCSKIVYGGTVEWRWYEAQLALLLEQTRNNIKYRMDAGE